MDTELALKLTALALVDATSFGTLVIPIWFLVVPGRPRAGRVITYLAAVAGAYFALGLALLAGLRVVFEHTAEWLHGDTGNTVLLYVGFAMFATGVLMPTRRRDAGAGRLMRRLARWRERALDERGGSRTLVTLALFAVAIEAASMVPYLAAIGLISGMPSGDGARVGVLAGYCLVMVVPTLALLAARCVIGGRIDTPLRRFGDWMERNSGENLAWALAIVGFFITRSAYIAGAQPPWR